MANYAIPTIFGVSADMVVLIFIVVVPFITPISSSDTLQTTAEWMCLIICGLVGLHCIRDNQNRGLCFLHVVILTALVLLFAALQNGEAIATSAHQRMRDPLLFLIVMVLIGVVSGFEPMHTAKQKLARAFAYCALHTIRLCILAQHLRTPAAQLTSLFEPGSKSRELLLFGHMNMVLAPMLGGAFGFALRDHMEASTKSRRDAAQAVTGGMASVQTIPQRPNHPARQPSDDRPADHHFADDHFHLPDPAAVGVLSQAGLQLISAQSKVAAVAAVPSAYRNRSTRPSSPVSGSDSFRANRSRGSSTSSSLQSSFKSSFKKSSFSFKARSCASSSRSSDSPRNEPRALPSVTDSLALALEYRTKWEEVKRLGSGGFGHVVLLHNPTTGEHAVAKRVPASCVNERQLVRIEREAKALAGLHSHPHIIGFRTCFLSGDHMEFITDYAVGGTLAQAIRRQRKTARSDANLSSPTAFPVMIVVRWLAQLLSALMRVHSHHILHRDLKPSNVFLTDSSMKADVKLGDFGLSASLLGGDSGDSNGHSSDGHSSDGEHAGSRGQLRMLTSAVGTPTYMSPEQIYGKAYSYPADAWSLGCIAFELLTLKRHVDAKSLPELALAIADEKGCADYRRNLLDRVLERSQGSTSLSLISLLGSDGLFHREADKRATLLEAARCISSLLGPEDNETSALIADEMARARPSSAVPQTNAPACCSEQDAAPAQGAVMQ